MLAAFGLLAWQLLVPGFIGLASNGDFQKIAGRLSIGGADNGADSFLYFEAGLPESPSLSLGCGLAVVGVHSCADCVGNRKARERSKKFDIRWLGGLQLLAWMAGYLLLLRVLRPLGGMFWWMAVSASLWIFMDVSYVSYFNSFYMDVAALLGVMAAVSAAVLSSRRAGPHGRAS